LGHLYWSMKTWVVSVYVIYHVSMSHQSLYHVHDLIYDKWHVMFVIFICITETRPRLGWAGLNLIYDGVETSQITSIYDGFCKKRHRVNLWHIMPRGRGKLGAEQRDLAGSSWLTDERLRSGTSTTQAQNKMGMRPTNKNQKFAPQKLNTIHIQPRRSSHSFPHFFIRIKI
jgi:hypothetical protein